MSNEVFTFFWSGPFSQWFRADFTLDGVSYNCTEQYMMAEKARLFKDDKTLELILKSTNPKEQKALGRRVKDFEENIWNKHAKEIVKRGNVAKFSQNTYLLNMLEKTKGTTLVESSPYDKIWGIGLIDSDPRALKRSTWLGQNWLGEILTEIRKDLFKE